MATKKLKGLGRGLDALLGGDAHDAPAAPANAPSSLKLAQVQAGKYQPRTRMDEVSLSELAASIKTQGIMQPVLVRPVDGAGGAGAARGGRRQPDRAGEPGDRQAPVGARDREAGGAFAGRTERPGPSRARKRQAGRHRAAGGGTVGPPGHAGGLQNGHQRARSDD